MNLGKRAAAYALMDKFADAAGIARRFDNYPSLVTRPPCQENKFSAACGCDRLHEISFAFYVRLIRFKCKPEFGKDGGNSCKFLHFVSFPRKLRIFRHV